MNNVSENLNSDVRSVKNITIAGLLINLALCALKIFAGFLGKSQAVIADGIHSLSDSVTDIAVIVGANFWSKEPDTTHPYGHRKVETVITVLIGAALALVGIFLAYNAIITLHQQHERTPCAIAFYAAVLSIIVKEWLYRWTISAGKRLKSSAMIANALHHRSDAFSSIPVAIAVATSFFLPEWSFLDHVATVAVSLFIIKAAWSILADPIHDLIEGGADDELIKKIEEISFSVPGVKGIHKIRSRSVSSAYFIDMHVEVDANLNIVQGHNIATDVKHKLLGADIGVIDALIHIEPYKSPCIENSP